MIWPLVLNIKNKRHPFDVFGYSLPLLNTMFCLTDNTLSAVSLIEDTYFKSVALVPKLKLTWVNLTSIFLVLGLYATSYVP